MTTHPRIGEFLLSQQLLNREQISELLKQQPASGKKLGQLVVEKQLLDEKEIAHALSDLMEIPLVDLKSFELDTDLLEIIPENIMRSRKAVPLFRIDKDLNVAMVDPRNLEALDELRRITGLDITPMLCTESDLQQALQRISQHTHSTFQEAINDTLRDIQLDIEVSPAHEDDTSQEALEVAAHETPIIRLSHLIISAAVKEGASDIHIEPDEHKLRVRFRIDGLMKESFLLDKPLQSALLSRFKIMSGLDISEKRLPQDGRFQTRIGSRHIDFRISSFPTIHGENIVMRILDKDAVTISLDKLGFDKVTGHIFSDIIRRPNGIILVTGPTGSGKTTTLYSALHAINDIDKNIITIEDPIEYRLEMIRQCQINARIGLTFASGLRSILRQDPDVIMVGEIRDRETAHIAVEAAMTGHLVFSTLHTNDAPGTIGRLTDMGIEPFLTASSLTAVLAQRLVRRLCDKCRQPYHPDKSMLKDWPATDTASSFYKPTGCPHCMNKGYRGRLALYELMVVDETIRHLILTKAPSSKIREASIDNGMHTLRYDGMRKAAQGYTSIEEVIRVTSE